MSVYVGAAEWPFGRMKKMRKQTIPPDLQDKIVQSIKASGVSGVAAIEGARLAQHWIEEAGEFDAQFPTIAAEVPFFVILDGYTILVGMMDRIAYGGNGGVFGSEWKTTKGTTKWWNEDKWIEEIKNGTQISIYGLGLRKGTFLLRGGAIMRKFDVERPHILVRAITKEKPPQLWGVNPPAFFEIPEKRLETIENTIILRGRQIRAAKMSKISPWAVPGLHCRDRFHLGEKCRFHEPYCSKGIHPKGEVMMSADDPGHLSIDTALDLLHTNSSDPRVVILSASAFSDYEDCPEKYRLTAIKGAEESIDLAKGTALHAGVKAYYNHGAEETEETED